MSNLLWVSLAFMSVPLFYVQSVSVCLTLSAQSCPCLVCVLPSLSCLHVCLSPLPVSTSLVLIWVLPLCVCVSSPASPVCSQLCLVVNVKFLFLSCLHGSLFLSLCPSLSLSILRSRFLPVSQYLVSLIWGCSLLTKFSSITWYFVSMFVVSVPLEKKKVSINGLTNAISYSVVQIVHKICSSPVHPCSLWMQFPNQPY